MKKTSKSTGKVNSKENGSVMVKQRETQYELYTHDNIVIQTC